MASMRDVAKKAGVGISTVSKVINNYDNISEETRKKVMKAVDELNYVPNSIASALSSKNGKRVGLVIFINNNRQAIDEINMQYLFGAFNKAKDLDLDVVTVFSTAFKDKNAQELEQHFKHLRVQSLIVYGLHKEQTDFIEFVEKETLPSVIVDAPFENDKTSSVLVDHQKAQYDITMQMVKDHVNIDKILYLAGRRDGFVTDLRLQGVVDATMDLGIELDAHYANFSEKEAFKLTKKYAEDANMIVCASDLMAIGAVSALKEMDIFRPVCGYDGIKLLGYIDFKITSVKQDFYKISQVAVQEVIRLMQGNPGRVKKLDYEITQVKYEDIIM